MGPKASMLALPGYRSCKSRSSGRCCSGCFWTAAGSGRSARLLPEPGLRPAPGLRTALDCQPKRPERRGMSKPLDNTDPEKTFCFEYLDRNAKAIAALNDSVFYFAE